MAITITIPASNALLTTAVRVRAELGLTTTDDDDVISDMIVRASSAIARETRRVFGVETVTETLDGSGSRLLGLARTPIVEVTDVLEDGSAITDYTVEDAEAGALYRANGWGRSGGLRMWGTEAYASGYILPGYQDQRYSVTYRAGYLLPSDVNPYLLEPTVGLLNLPGAVEQACLETVKAWFRVDRDANAGPVGLKRLTVGSVTMEWVRQQDTGGRALPPSALSLLRNYYQAALR